MGSTTLAQLFCDMGPHESLADWGIIPVSLSSSVCELAACIYSWYSFANAFISEAADAVWFPHVSQASMANPPGVEHQCLYMVHSRRAVKGLDLASALEMLKWPVVLGDAPSGEAVLVAKGKYGFYVQQGGLKASLGKVCLLLPGTTQCMAPNIIPASVQHSLQRQVMHDTICECVACHAAAILVTW